MRMFRIIYIIFLLVIYFFVMYFSNNLYSEPTSWKWFILTWVFSCCIPIWAIVSIYSNDLLFDAALFDITIFISSILSLIVLNRNVHDIKLNEIIGIVIMIIGLITFKLNNILKF